MFDEWAAEQDPRYKDLFYMEIISRLRGIGKLIVVDSHDDRYFSAADRILWLERGELPMAFSGSIWRAAKGDSAFGLEVSNRRLAG